MSATPGFHDPHDLARFMEAQQGCYDSALAEVAAGHKRSHWMWFIFPQLKGLGRSATAAYFGLAGLPEARAYLAHPLLGPRLREVTRAALLHATAGAHALFGSPDDLKFHASMTLFDLAEPDAVFSEALAAFFAGRLHASTLRLLGLPSDK